MTRPNLFLASGWTVAAGLALFVINPPAGALLMAAAGSVAIGSEVIK